MFKIFFNELIIVYFGNFEVGVDVMIIFFWFGSGCLIDLYVFWFIMIEWFDVIFLKYVRLLGKCYGKLLFLLISLLVFIVKMNEIIC